MYENVEDDEDDEDDEGDEDDEDDVINQTEQKLGTNINQTYILNLNWINQYLWWFNELYRILPNKIGDTMVYNEIY